MCFVIKNVSNKFHQKWSKIPLEKELWVPLKRDTTPLPRNVQNFKEIFTLLERKILDEFVRSAMKIP